MNVYHYFSTLYFKYVMWILIQTCRILANIRVRIIIFAVVPRVGARSWWRQKQRHFPLLFLLRGLLATVGPCLVFTLERPGKYKGRVGLLH